MRRWLPLLLVVMCGLCASEARTPTPTSRTAGIIVDGVLHVVVMAPPFLCAYASEAAAQGQVFEGPITGGSTFDYDIAAGHLYVLGARSSRPPDERPRLTRYVIPAGLSATVSSITAKNGHVLNGLTAEALTTPGLMSWERIGGLPQGSGWFQDSAITVGTDGRITIATVSTNQGCILERPAASASGAAAEFVLQGKPKDVVGTDPQLLHSGGTVGFLIVTSTTVMPLAAGAVSTTAAGLHADLPGVLIDKDAGRCWSIGGASSPALAGIQPADAAALRRHAAVMAKAQAAIAATQQALGYVAK